VSLGEFWRVSVSSGEFWLVSVSFSMKRYRNIEKLWSCASGRARSCVVVRGRARSCAVVWVVLILYRPNWVGLEQEVVSFSLQNLQNKITNEFCFSNELITDLFVLFFLILAYRLRFLGTCVTRTRIMARHK
jgi:hypothetical protein